MGDRILTFEQIYLKFRLLRTSSEGCILGWKADHQTTIIKYPLMHDVTGFFGGLKLVSLEGKTLGKYRLIEQLGRGGFASVYKAYHARLDRYVAVKVLHPHLVEGEDFLSRFEREARAVATLRHPNIVIVHDFDVESNIYYMIMEFIDGLSMKEKLVELNTSKMFLPLSDVGGIMGNVTSALDYAHDCGMLHRDVKPSNVILNSVGEAFLTDFGIARILSSTQFTATGALIGTPAYMSPEQGQGLSVSPASDVYSLGVMLYEFLTGRVPFDADTPLAVIFKHISDPLPSIRTIRPDLPEALERVIYKSLAKDPEDRFKSPGEMMALLNDILAQISKSETVIQVQKHPKPGVDKDAVGLESLDQLPESKEPPQPPPGKVADSEDAKAPTVAVERDLETDVEDIESADDVEVPATDTPESEASKAPTIAVEGEPFETTPEVTFEGPDSVGGEIDIESYKAPTVAIAPEMEKLVEEIEDEIEVQEVDGIPESAPKKRKRGKSRFYWLGGSLFVILIFSGLILSNVFNTGDQTKTNQIAFEATVTKKPTKNPSPTALPEPTEIPGLAVFEDGMILFHEEQNYTEAIIRFDQAEELGFTEPKLYGNRGWACHEAQIYLGECSFEGAIRDYTRAIALDPNQAYFYSNRAWSFIHMEQWGNAIDDYSRAIELEPDNADYWIGRGDVFGRIGELDSALADINHAIALQPENDGFYATRAWAYLNAGDLEASAEDFGKAIELAPENPEYWRERGWRYLDMGLFEEAITDFEQAHSLFPEAIWAYVGKAFAYTRMGDFDAAIHNMDTAISIEPRRDRLFVIRAHLLWWDFGEIEAAVEDLKKAIEINPENWEAHINLGEIYTYEFGNPDQGLQYFNQGVDLVPRGIDTPFVVRGNYFAHVEEWEKAIKDYTMGIRIQPENPDGYGHRGYAHQRLGMLDDARANYEMFLELTQEKPEYDPWREEIETWLEQNP
jgi:serine/threonine-protein kinase